MTEQINPELQGKLTSILEWVEETAKQAEAFAIEQTPLYIQELLAWNFWYSLVWFAVGIIWLIIFFACLSKIMKGKEEFWEEENVSEAVPTLIGAIIGLFASPIFISNNFEWLQITIAPRVWLVEYVTSKL